MQKNIAESSVKRCAGKLRAKLTKCADGQFLGSEDELVALFGVSKPTFRQAAKLLEHENLLRIKRGVGGGYFARRPDMNAVAHMTAVYLGSRNAALIHAVHVTRALYVETAIAAAENPDQMLKQELAQFIDTPETRRRQMSSMREFLHVERLYSRKFAELSSNPVMELFLNIVYDFTGDTGENVYAGQPKRVEKWITLRTQLIEAILTGDAKKAEAAAKKCQKATEEWMRADMNEEQLGRKLILKGNH